MIVTRYEGVDVGCIVKTCVNYGISVRLTKTCAVPGVRHPHSADVALLR